MPYSYLLSSFFALCLLFNPPQPPPQAEPGPFCASHQINRQYQADHPEVLKRHLDLEDGYYHHPGDQPEVFPYTLPVVVHVIHNNGPENISDATVLQGIQHLNEAFSNSGYYDPATGVNTQIQFCLAKQDPDGLFTTGIHHVVSPLTDLDMETQDLALKDLIRWDPLRYINIWVVGEICSNTTGCDVAGYSYYPASHGSNVDGIVVEAAYLGSSPANSGVLVHEMGHYLGLYHTFEGACANDDCLADGDKVCDTPPDQSTVPAPCDDPPNSCTTDPDSGFATDQDDMIINYMDYGDLECYSAFTQGQKDRMGFFIDGARSSLLDSPACNDACTIPIAAGFTASATLVDVGDPVNFTNTTTGATTWQWLVDGVPFASTPNASYSFSSEGVYTITLVATNADPNCYETFEMQIQVTCPVIADFAASSTEVTPGTVVYFTNLSQNAVSWEWFLDGVPVSTAFLWDYLFAANGNYDVQLVASNGNCTDTSAITVITVSTTGLAQTGLPVWPLSSNAGLLSQTIDWQTQPPVISPIPNGVSITPGPTGAAFDGCGNLVFYALHTGSGSQNNLFLYAPDGTELLSNSTPNGPGLNGVKGSQETQVVRVPQETDEWYIIYRKWATDAGALGGSGAYTPAPFLYSRVRLDENGLVVLQKDIALPASGGNTYVYNDGAAVSRTAAGNVNAHYLYLARRPLNSNTLSLDRFLIDNTGIVFSANTGNVAASYWDLTHAGSHIELSPTEDRIAVCNRNQFNGYQDFLIFDAAAFNNAAVQVITGNSLFLVPDGTANDQSSVLPAGGTIQSIAANNALPLRFLQNFDKKLAALEFSPNGRFLYVGDGGYALAGSTNITYLAQIDLESNPLEVRLQIQTTPGNSFDPLSGAGCAIPNCGTGWHSIGHIETAFDGNLYFTKANSNTLFVIPDPNNIMPQNLVPSDIDLSAPGEPNLTATNIISILPDPIDGFNYYLSQFSEAAVPIGGSDCDGCRAPFTVQVMQNGEVTETFTVSACPDTLYFCADTSLVYQLYEPALGLTYDSAVVHAQPNLPADSTGFDFSDLSGCTELCSNGIDDDNDGFTDCADPDLAADCCCATALTLDLGPDISLCENGVVALDAGPGFDTYLWPDLSYEQTFTAYGPGIYWVVATDSCGTVYSDSLEITLDPNTVLDLGPDRVFCENEGGVVFTLSGFDSWHWYPSDFLDCDSCETVTAQPDASATYVVVASTAGGCFSADTIGVSVGDTSLLEISIQVCNGEAADYNGQPLAAGSVTPFVFQGFNGCDSTVVVAVAGLPDLAVSLPADTSIHQGQSITIKPNISNQPGLSFLWSPPDGLDCPTCEDVVASPEESTLYTLQVISPEGCTGEDAILIQVLADRRVYIPNSFTPNFDGINDYFLPFAGRETVQVLDFRIFDRWGSLVFQRQRFNPNDTLLGWDGTFHGKPLNTGLYTFFTEIEFEDGEVEVFKGGVLLVR